MIECDDMRILRLHVAACWGLRVPPLAPGEFRVARDGAIVLDDAEPAWALYVGDTELGTARLWREGVAATARSDLLARAALAHDLPLAAALPEGVTREVVLAQRASPRQTSTQARRIARQLTPGDGTLFEQFERESAPYYTNPRKAPVFGVVRDGRLIAVAHSSRRTGQACELGVETLPEARRRGYALAVTVCWAAAVTAEGLEPLYSALATNQASLALAAAAGYRVVARATYVAGSA